MSVDRVATAQQSAYLLTQINQAGVKLDDINRQIASGVVADTYAGFGDQAQVLQASISAHGRNEAYARATTLAVTQVDLQNTQLDTLSDMAAQLKKAVADTVANNDPRVLMAQVESIFSQAVTILNSKDANGDYIYSGGRTDIAPVSISTLSQLIALPSAPSAFTNGFDRKSVQVGDGQSVTFGVVASEVGTDLMQALRDIAVFDASGAGNFDGNTNLSGPQASFLSGQIPVTDAVAQGLVAVTARNGHIFKQLETVQEQQSSMATLYAGFIDKIQNTNMAEAATQLSLNQTALQAALQVTATLNQLSLLNYMPIR